MTVTLSLFGAFRDYQPDARIRIDLADGARIADLRVAVDAYGRAHWPGFRPELLRVSAFASSRDVLRDGEPVPADGELAVLPPVSGG